MSKVVFNRPVRLFFVLLDRRRMLFPFGFAYPLFDVREERCAQITHSLISLYCHGFPPCSALKSDLKPAFISKWQKRRPQVLTESDGLFLVLPTSRKVPDSIVFTPHPSRVTIPVCGGADQRTRLEPIRKSPPARIEPSPGRCYDTHMRVWRGKP